MAITQRTGPHNAWLVCGQAFQCLDGDVVIKKNGEPSSFDVNLPLNAPGYAAFFKSASGETQGTIVVQTAFGEDTLISSTKLKKVEFDLIAGIIHVHGEDQISDLNTTKDSSSYKNQYGSQIVQQLCGKLGIACQADQSQVMAGKKVKDDYVKLTDNSPYGMIINKLSQMDGARYWIDPKTSVLHYSIQNGGAGAGGGGGGGYTLFCKLPLPGSPMISDCLALTVIHNLEAASLGPGDGKSWQPQTKQLVTGQSQQTPGAAAPASGGGGGALGGGAGGLKYYVQDTPNLQQQQNQQLIENMEAAGGQHEWEVRATVVGDGSLSSVTQVQVTGTGLFDMSYEVDKITHRFGYGGFTSTINSRSKGKSSGQ